MVLYQLATRNLNFIRTPVLSHYLFHLGPEHALGGNSNPYAGIPVYLVRFTSPTPYVSNMGHKK